MADAQERERLVAEIKRKVDLLLQADSISEEEKLLIIEQAFGEIKGFHLKEVQDD